MNKNRGRLIVISGPSGAGKGTLVKALREKRPDIELSVSVTTRKKRRGEKEGLDYYFISEELFREYFDRGLFIESACVHDSHYGTLRSEIQEAISKNKSIILEIDVQGARQIKQSWGEGVFIFVTAPSIEHLRKRLLGRMTEESSQLELRLRNAEKEIGESYWFDHIIVNSDMKKAINELIEIVDKETQVPKEGE